jgi:hypothetical protein
MKYCLADDLRDAVKCNDFERTKAILQLYTPTCPNILNLCNTSMMLELLLKTGLDVNKTFQGTPIKFINVTTLTPFGKFILLLDYGYCLSSIDCNLSSYTARQDYISLVKQRIDISRRSLCALIWCFRNGLFPAKRGIIMTLTKRAWAQRGGEGCGARGILWKKEL